MNLVYGIGINDILKGSSGCIYYRKWSSMINRCYSESYHKNQPSYIGCSVCEDWLTFSKFKAWMETQDWEGKELDKDLLVSGNKVYSPETCVFISKELNLFLLERKASRGLYPIGVVFDKTKNKFRSQVKIKGRLKHLGYFKTAEEAHEAWLSKKLEIAIVFASEEKDSRIAKAIVEKYQSYQHKEID